MTILILFAILLLILPVAWRQRIVRRVLVFVSALVVGALCIHVLLVASVIIHSRLFP